MTIFERRQAKRFVGPRILRIPNANECLAEEFDDSGQHLVFAEGQLAQIGGDLTPQLGECASEGNHPVVLRLVSDLAPARMIAVLFATPCIAPRRLQVRVGIRRDPYGFPCRRNRQLPDTLQGLEVGNRAATGANVAEPVPRAHATDATTAVA
jgi:hypothetical protein